MSSDSFNIGYADADVYEETLPPHHYRGQEDVDVVRELLAEVFGAPPEAPVLRVLDLGCGPGRVTEVLAPYATDLHVADKSAGMVERVRQRFPRATSFHADTESLVAKLLQHGPSGTYDLIGSFWSMNYPLLDCFEETTAEGVRPNSDFDDGLRRAGALVRGVIDLLAPGGHFIALFFDAESAEQRLVTRLWERIAPFPGGGRDFTWRLLLSGLQDAEASGQGRLTVSRLPGVAMTPDALSAARWFTVVHLNSLPELVDAPDVRAEIERFVAAHAQPDGSVLIPSGVHVVDFHKGVDNRTYLPPALR
ncbi:hypothetical protein SUDANB95_04900 [Actinosynnema sp. ALI-1.44]